MPITTDLNVSPYFDDFSEEKDYYKILFKPGVSVQVRELNQLQTLLQKQVERFGDHVFKRGTIVDGCNFIINNRIPYAKIKDKQIDGELVQVTNYTGLFAKNSSNLVSIIVDAIPGLESTDPDLNTLYLKYLNSGNDSNSFEYSNSEIIKIYDANNSIYKVNIIDGGQAFANSDSVVFLSALEIQNTSGGLDLSNTFVVGEVITQTTTGAKALVVSVNTTANTEATILKIRPLPEDLEGSNTLAWAFNSNLTITASNSEIVANVVGLIGSGASATLVTEGVSGRIISISMTNRGQDYYVEPYVAINSGTGTVSTVNLTAQNYLAEVTVDTTGFGYGFGVTEGIIYQKGYFSRVQQQEIIVSKYSTEPDQLVVGFNTTETVVNSFVDSSLLDNVTGTNNRNAPGADRLQLTPELIVLNKSDAEANDAFFSIVEFSEGRPYRQNQSTTYNKIADELAKRTFEESGNYVIDPFYLNTKSVSVFANESNTFNVVIDPGTAYINGYRVSTQADNSITTEKGVNTVKSEQTVISIDYGNYIRVREFGGSFNFAIGDIVSLRSAAATYLTTGSLATPTGAGTELGTARVRSVTYESGEPGTVNAIYRIYLFDIRMNSGRNFADVRSVFYNGSVKGVADLVLEIEGTTGKNIAVVREISKSSMLIPTGVNAVKSISNTTYTYRTVANAVANTSGFISITVSDPEYFPYLGSLSDNEQEELIVVPLANTLAAANSTGSVALTSGNSIITGTSTQFASEYVIGDYINVFGQSIYRITSIANNTSLTVSPTPSSTTGSANHALAFPQFVPVPISTRSNRTANVTNNEKTLNIFLGTDLSAAANVSISYNVTTTENSVTKTTNRLSYVKIQANTNIAGTTGPWCLGVPDIFRLRNVYVGDGTVNTSSTSVTNEFYIDHNQNENYLGLGYLYKKPGSTYTVPNDAVLLVEYDALTVSSAGLTTIESYPVNDTLPLSLLDIDSTMNTIEIPEVFGKKGEYFDLRDYLDFRPVSNSALVTSNVASAPINPVEFSETDRFDDAKFPAPQSDVILDIEYYVGRNDRAIVTATGDFKIVKGVPGDLNSLPPAPKDSITINTLTVPAYPSLPTSLSASMIELIDTKVANERFTKHRIELYRIKTLNNEQSIADQPRRYTMSDIGSIARRVESLEYYTSLSLVETQIKDRIIPSSNDPATNRFKFGFFVDNFETEQFADKNNPSYNATIFNSQLGPKKKNLIFKFKFNRADEKTDALVNGTKLTLPYSEVSLIQQMNATDGPLITQPGQEELPPVLVPSATCIDVYNKNSNYAPTAANVVEVTEFKLSEQSSPANIFFDVYGGVDRIEVYQSPIRNFNYTTLQPVITSEQAVNLTSTDRSNLEKDKALFNNSRKNWSLSARPNFTFVTKGTNNKFWVRGAGKISWTHNPNNGVYYKIVVVKGSPHHSYRFCYTQDLLQVAPTPLIPKPNPLSYEGIFVYKNPELFKLQGIGGNTQLIRVGVGKPAGGASYVVSLTGKKQKVIAVSDTGYLVSSQGARTGRFPGPITTEVVPFNTFSNLEQKFEFKLTNLKPNTKHSFIFDGVDQSVNCQQIGKLIGADLISDASGELVFYFYYNTGLANNLLRNTFAQYQAELNRLAGIKTVVVRNTDSTSKAETTLYFATDVETQTQTQIQTNVSEYGGLALNIGSVNPVLNLNNLTSGIGTGTVICTALYNKGYLSEEIWAADNIYGQNIRVNDPYVYSGYIWWAETVASWIEQSDIVADIVSFLAVPWAKQMASELTGSKEIKSLRGKAILKFGVPLCRALGKLREKISTKTVSEV